jgi:hypothetical protein
MKTVPKSASAPLSFSCPLFLLALAACSGSVGAFPSTELPLKEIGVDGAVDGSTADRTVEGPDSAPPRNPDASSPPVKDATAPLLEAAAPPSACGGYLVCDDFESAPAGGPPSPMLWPHTTPSDCDNNSGSITIDDTEAHSGRHSVKVVGGAAYCDHVFFVNTSAFPVMGMGTELYARFYVRFAGTAAAVAPNAFAAGHATFMRMTDSQANGKHLRLGGWNEIFAWNRESDGVTLPLDVASGSASVPTGSVAPAAKAWMCVEVHLNQNAGTIDTWVNGNEVPDLVEDGSMNSPATAFWQNPSWKPTFTDFQLGWESYDSETGTLWFDDVVIDRRRVGCAN